MGDWILITADDLPTLPHVASRVLSVVGNPSSSAKDLQQVIEADQALSERLLRMSNSALFGGTKQVTNLRAAITRLGFNRVRNLVLIASTKDVYRKKDPLAAELWKHALAVGIATRLVGTEIGMRPGELDDLFLAGLFHDIGKVLINTQKPDRYQEVLQASLDQGQPMSIVEKEVFKFTHEEVGVMVVQKWGMPELLINPIRHHHTVQESAAPDEKSVAMIATADLIANGLGFGVVPPSVDAVSARSTQVLGLSEAGVEKIRAELPELFTSQISAFE